MSKSAKQQKLPRSIKAFDFIALQAEICYKDKFYRCDLYTRCEGETAKDMREQGYIYISNSAVYGREVWIDSRDLQLS